MAKPRILLLVTGSIAAYKACALVSKLTKNGFAVKVAMSAAARKFIGTTSFEALSGQAVAIDTFEEGNALDHIYLIREADLVICAPATGNFINKIAAGIADDLLTTLTLAHDFQKPFLIAPAMNTQMYINPVTQASIKTLTERGFNVLETASGELACHEIGSGKLLESEVIFDEIMKALGIKSSETNTLTKNGKKILITSGGCVEQIDNVRAITNTSSGKTGALLADILSANGYEIVLLSAKKGIHPKTEIETHEFTNFNSLQEKLFALLGDNSFDALIHTAAVSDYSVGVVMVNGARIDNNTKIPSSNQEIEVKLVKNPKLINQVKAKYPNIKLIGFKLTNDCDAESVKAAIDKQIAGAHPDLIVHNCLAGISGDKSQHEFNIFDDNGTQTQTIKGVNALGEILSDFLK